MPTKRDNENHHPPSAPIWMPVTVREMKAFVGLCFAMGVLRLPSRNDYWRQTKWFLKTEFGKVISRDRFNLIWRYLHPTNNDIPAAIGDKLSKVRWYIDFLNNQFQTVYVPYAYLPTIPDFPELLRKSVSNYGITARGKIITDILYYGNLVTLGNNR